VPDARDVSCEPTLRVGGRIRMGGDILRAFGCAVQSSTLFALPYVRRLGLRTSTTPPHSFTTLGFWWYTFGPLVQSNSWSSRAHTLRFTRRDLRILTVCAHVLRYDAALQRWMNWLLC